MRIKRLFTDDNRQIMVAALAFTGFGFVSLHHIFRNQGTELENLGTIITLYALVSIARGRNTFTTALADLDKLHLKRYKEIQRVENNFRAAATKLTFDLHASQIGQIAGFLGRRSAFGKPGEPAFDAMVRKVQMDLDNEAEFLEMQESNARKIEAFDLEYAAKVKRYKSWSHHLGSVDLFLAVWGTMQGAFGSELVIFVHELMTRSAA